MKKSYLSKILAASAFSILGQLTQAETMEVVVFNTKAKVSAQQVIESAESMLQTMQSWDGFISRELVKVGNGKWIDIVHWDNKENATLAQERAMKSEVCLVFFSLIDDKQQQFFHGEIVLTQND